jgi:hypothetical protein
MILVPSQRLLAGTPPALPRHFRIKIVAYHVHMNRARLAERAGVKIALLAYPGYFPVSGINRYFRSNKFPVMPYGNQASRAS